MGYTGKQNRECRFQVKPWTLWRWGHRRKITPSLKSIFLVLIKKSISEKNSQNLQGNICTGICHNRRWRWQRCILVIYAEFFWTDFLQSTFWWLLLRIVLVISRIKRTWTKYRIKWNWLVRKKDLIGWYLSFLLLVVSFIKKIFSPGEIHSQKTYKNCEK